MIRFAWILELMGWGVLVMYILMTVGCAVFPELQYVFGVSDEDTHECRDAGCTDEPAAFFTIKDGTPVDPSTFPR